MSTGTNDGQLATIHTIVDQFQKRWAANGLDPQMSLERAASFEMLLLLALWSMQYLSSMFFETHSQTERHHKEKMDAPSLREIRRLRNQIWRIPFNTNLLLLAIASKIGLVMESQPLLMSAHNALFSTVCSSCTTPSIEAYHQVYDYFITFQFGRFLTSIYYGLAVAGMLWCVTKIAFLASICGALIYYQYFPKQVIVIFVVLIVWRGIILLIFAVFILNFILMLFVRWASDATGKRLNAMDSESHYEQCILIGTVLSWCTSIGVGYCFSVLSRDTAWQYVVVAAQYI
jgi:hypothetical protein